MSAHPLHALQTGTFTCRLDGSDLKLDAVAAAHYGLGDHPWTGTVEQLLARVLPEDWANANSSGMYEAYLPDDKRFYRSLPFRILYDDGQLHWLRVNSFVDERDMVWGVVERVDAQVQLQEQLSDLKERALAHARAQTAKQLSTIIAHDINNLLSAIIPSLQLSIELTSDQELLSLLEPSIVASLRIAELVNQLTSTAQLHQRPHPLHINTIFEQLATLLTRLIPQPLTIHPSSSHIPLYAMATQGALIDVLTNLIKNAAEAPNATQVQLRLRDDEPGWVIIEVIDDGDGFSPHILARLGEPFLTTKLSTGHGLGLASVKHRLDQLGAQLHVTRQDARTIVSAHLLHVDAPQAAPPLPRGEWGKQRDILIWSEDPQLTHILKASTSAVGFQVHIATSLPVALQLNGALPLHAIIVDNLYHDQALLAPLTRALSPQTKLIFLESLPVEQPAAATIIPKPFTIDALFRQLN